jgi:hypothetical protein
LAWNAVSDHEVSSNEFSSLTKIVTPKPNARDSSLQAKTEYLPHVKLDVKHWAIITAFL